MRLLVKEFSAVEVRNWENIFNRAHKNDEKMIISGRKMIDGQENIS